FEITPENAVGISQIAQSVLERYSVAERTQVLAGVFLEDMLELIMEKNGNPGRIGNPGDTVNTGDTGNGGKTGSEGKPGNTGKHRRPGRRLRAECTLIVDPSGVRVILRDSGVIFDITDDDAIASSFRQYVVANMMAAQENKAYLVTTGYNRTELFFSQS
ncbi:MAG: hypothetical protein Q4D81_13755, partial [Eubacteriales bacterium]|nr:hypothetical protein [Eubacteriales bacterium]